MEQLQGGGESPAFVPVDKVTCISFSDTKERKRNMRWCMKQGYKPITDMIVNLDDPNIAIVAGGPSLNQTYKEISNFKYVMTCGSVHDHALELGIKPVYHIECDPHIHQIRMYKRWSNANYLVSSRCHRSMFRTLESRRLYLWHMWESELGKPVYKGQPAFICGSTVALAAVPLALTLQFKNLHFFGFDSSFEDKEKHHAYPQPETAQMLQIRVGDQIKGRQFETTATWLGQVQQFEDMQNNWQFNTTIYGDSLMAEVQKLRKMELEKQGVFS